jgi:hypothetical protein
MVRVYNDPRPRRAILPPVFYLTFASSLALPGRAHSLCSTPAMSAQGGNEVVSAPQPHSFLDFELICIAQPRPSFWTDHRGRRLLTPSHEVPGPRLTGSESTQPEINASLSPVVQVCLPRECISLPTCSILNRLPLRMTITVL